MKHFFTDLVREQNFEVMSENYDVAGLCIYYQILWTEIKVLG